MGAGFDYRIFVGKPERMEAWWRNQVESSQTEDGNSYSGCIGMFGSGYSKRRSLCLCRKTR